ncbi:hypothetical protein D3C80_832530 [compost metagenome]
MPHFRQGNRLDELRGEQRVTLDTFIDHETAGNQSESDSYRKDDCQADKGVPAQQVERPLGRRFTAFGFFTNGQIQA